MIPVEQLESLLETAARPGVLGLAGRKIEKRCAADLRGYFGKLAARVKGMELEKLADGDAVDAALARHTVEMKMSNAMRQLSTDFLAIMSSNIFDAMVLGDRQQVVYPLAKVNAARRKNGLAALKEADQIDLASVDKVGLTGQDAADYAAQRAAKLVKGINDTTRQKIADAVASGIEDRLGVGGLSRVLRQLMDDMTSSRSDMIASTEMNDAMSEAALRKMRRIGVEYKQIILSDDACEICQDNADSDPIPVDDDYPSGDSRSPFHPNCRCATTGARPPQDDTEEGD